MSNDLWRTPDPVFDTLDKEFYFYADMAASNANAKLDRFFDEDADSLSFDWADVLKSSDPEDPTRYVWLNCPYSKPMPWVLQSAKAQRKGLGVVMLLNADNSVGWFAEALKTVSEIRYVTAIEKEEGKYSSGRIAFLDADGKPGGGNDRPQVILIFNPFKIGARITSYVSKEDFYLLVP